MDNILQNESFESGCSSPSKNDQKELSESEWTTVVNKKKVKRAQRNQMKGLCRNKNTVQQVNTSAEQTEETKRNYLEVLVLCKRQFPEPFELNELLKESKIENIIQVKYLSPRKLRLIFATELSADNMFNNRTLMAMGWNCIKQINIFFTFGVLRDIDYEIEADEIFNDIRCPGDNEVIEVKRLNRLCVGRFGWEESKAIRICFRGTLLPPYVITNCLRIKVEPYVSPVTRCARCLRVGEHDTQNCTSKEKVCNRCAENHDSCTTNDFKCVNCSGNHMAVARTCPIFLKMLEMKRSMAESNCKYTAMNLNVSRKSPTHFMVHSVGFNSPILNTSVKADETKSKVGDNERTIFHIKPHTKKKLKVRSRTYAGVVKGLGNVENESAPSTQNAEEQS